MIIAGVNSGRAVPSRLDPKHARVLSDGSSALLVDGAISCATIEERHTRTKYQSGFRHSLTACLNHAGIGIEQIDWIGHSTCCDSTWSREADIVDDLTEELDGIYESDRLRNHLKGRVSTIDHHESHAMLAFVSSGCPEALVCVIDGIGNRIGTGESFNLDSNWWKGAFHRQSYYRAQWCDGFVRLMKVHEEACGPDEIGLGELYRCLTHYLGWTSYQYAGKAMALAAYGDRNAFSRARFVDASADGAMHVLLTNRHDAPIQQMEERLQAAGIAIPAELHKPASPDAAFLCDLAAAVQGQLETGITKVVGYLADKFGLKNVCISGGVGLNCLATGKLRAERPDMQVWVAPAPGDTGQGLGNALWLRVSEKSPVRHRSFPKPLGSSGLGPAYSPLRWEKAVADYLARAPHAEAQRFDADDRLSDAIATALADGDIVGLKRSRSEYGPRALGRSSILADPRAVATHQRVNSIKHREPFRPYAPSILADRCGEYFETPGPSPYMSFASRVRDEVKKKIPAVVHVDGTARYHTVSDSDGLYGAILQRFNARTNVPVLLNTSFNVDGEPVVETPADAIAAFENSDMPTLAIGRWLIRKPAAARRNQE